MLSIKFLSLCLLATAAIASQCRKNAYSHFFTVGNLSAVITSDGPIILSPSGLFSVPDVSVARAYTRLFRPIDPVVWSQNSLVIDHPSGRILVDTGAFNTGLQPVSSAGILQENLLAAGIQSESIDFVLLTHGHPDHVAGLVTEEGQRAFVNAKVIVLTKEHLFWSADPVVNPSKTLEDGFVEFVSKMYRRSLEPYKQAGRVKLVTNGEWALPGVRFLKGAGHTPGHSTIEISHAGERLVVIGDTWFTQPDQVRNPDWVRPTIDTNVTEAVESRLRVLQRVARRGDLVLAYHEDFPGLGHVVETSDSFDWVAARTGMLGSVVGKCV